MKRLMLLSLVLALAGCGGTRGRDPLAGLAGPTDPSRFGFEGGVSGWAKPASDASSTYQVMAAPGRSFFGSASLAVAVQQMGNVDAKQGRVSIVLPVPATDIAGKTLTAWVYAPAGSQYSDSAPSYAVFYLKDGSNRYANGSVTNMMVGNWVQIQFAPVANPSAVDVSGGGGAYTGANFDPSTINEIGIKMAATGAAPASFGFDGVFLVDSVNW